MSCPTYYRGYRLTLTESPDGWSILIEGKDFAERFGFFGTDYQAHYAATQTIDAKHKAGRPVKDKPRLRSVDCPVPQGPEHFPARLLWTIRASCLYSSHSLGRRTGIATREIDAWIHGQKSRPTIGTIVRLADVLKCRAIWLEDGTGEIWVVKDLPEPPLSNRMKKEMIVE